MKMVPFPEHLDRYGADSHIVIDSENYVVCSADGVTFQVTIEPDIGDPVEDRVTDVEVIWNAFEQRWQSV